MEDQMLDVVSCVLIVVLHLLMLAMLAQIWIVVLEAVVEVETWIVRVMVLCTLL